MKGKVVSMEVLEKQIERILEEIAAFAPDSFDWKDPEEAAVKGQMLGVLLQERMHPFFREREEAHFTASGMILNPEMDKALMVYHNIYQSISWTGGHADGETDLLSKSISEAREETGIQEVYPLTGAILALDLLPVVAHEKRGKPVPAHHHFSVAYGLIAPERQILQVKEDENSLVEWIPLEDLDSRCSEPHMMPVYRKLIHRMREIREKKLGLYEMLPEALEGWYQENARDLPWRKDREPYHVWLSEIMLQQTRVEAVKGYYSRFLEAFPRVEDLAEGDMEQLMKLWEGLGYYNRAKNLQKAAKEICRVHGGRFPQDFEGLFALPGIGEYTAGAIGSICFELPVPAVDGNVFRVISRVTEDFDDIGKPGFKKKVTEILRGVYERNASRGGSSGLLTQSLMELGAIVCVPNGSPKCEICPCQEFCLAKKNGTVLILPRKEKKMTRRVEEKTVFIFLRENELAVRKRPEDGLLASLWELPNTEGILAEEEALKMAGNWGMEPLRLERSVKKKHIFSHVEWKMVGYYIRCREGEKENWGEEIAEESPGRKILWAEKDRMEQEFALPTAFKQFL